MSEAGVDPELFWKRAEDSATMLEAVMRGTDLTPDDLQLPDTRGIWGTVCAVLAGDDVAGVEKSTLEAMTALERTEQALGELGSFLLSSLGNYLIRGGSRERLQELVAVKRELLTPENIENAGNHCLGVLERASSRAKEVDNQLESTSSANVVAASHEIKKLCETTIIELICVVWSGYVGADALQRCGVPTGLLRHRLAAGMVALRVCLPVPARMLALFKACGLNEYHDAVVPSMRHMAFWPLSEVQTDTEYDIDRQAGIRLRDLLPSTKEAHASLACVLQAAELVMQGQLDQVEFEVGSEHLARRLSEARQHPEDGERVTGALLIYICHAYYHQHKTLPQPDELSVDQQAALRWLCQQSETWAALLQWLMTTRKQSEILWPQVQAAPKPDSDAAIRELIQQLITRMIVGNGLLAVHNQYHSWATGQPHGDMLAELLKHELQQSNQLLEEMLPTALASISDRQLDADSRKLLAELPVSPAVRQLLEQALRADATDATQPAAKPDAKQVWEQLEFLREAVERRPRES